VGSKVQGFSDNRVKDKMGLKKIIKAKKMVFFNLLWRCGKMLWR